MTSNAPAQVLEHMSEVLNHIRKTARVYINAKDLWNITPKYSLQDHLLSKVKNKYERVCTKDGLTMSIGTADAICSSGEAPAEHLNGSLLYTLTYSAYVCSPVVNQIIDVVVTSFNRIGLLCQYFPFPNVVDSEDDSIVDSTTFARFRSKSNCIIVLVPKALNLNKPTCKSLYVAVEDRLADNDTLRLRLRVQILQKKFDIFDKQISTVGMLVPYTS